MKYLLPLVSMLCLVGCDDEAATPPPTPSAAPRKKAVEAAPVAATTQVDYVYSALNRRDPFRSFVELVDTTKTGPQGPQVEGCTEPLCLIDTDELKVVAVVSGDANPLAMVEDRGGTGHIVRRNTRIGKQGGKVIQILRDCIVVLSFVSGGADGKPQPNKQNLCVQAEAAGGAALDLLKNKEFVP